MENLGQRESLIIVSVLDSDWLNWFLSRQFCPLFIFIISPLPDRFYYSSVSVWGVGVHEGSDFAMVELVVF